MKERLRMTVTTVRQETFIAAPALRLQCPVCEREVEMVTEDQAVRILEIDPSGLCHLAEAGRLHSIQTVTGNTWVCKDSLFASSPTAKAGSSR
jgi:hypothetical protein